MDIILNILPIPGTFLVLFALFFIVYSFILKNLFKLKDKIIFKKFYLYEILSIILSVLTVFCFFEISSPFN